MSFSALDAEAQTNINKPIRENAEYYKNKKYNLDTFNKCIKNIQVASLNGYNEASCKNISQFYEKKLELLGYKLVRAGVKHHDCLYVAW